ncbi:MAG TPA: sugar phosphate nucleotidyltransferase [Anaerolineae bacterium]|nr:sugar phosphate nucleotidyltransferase [Anaerolineae bacterium]HNU02707.1 sugar phosphate nucleotidyltransferase [Anaerolineae bacterium]
MKLILPVAGYGKRMRPHTWSRPKVLIDVAGKPMLGHVLDQFDGVGIDEVIYITGWLGEQIKPYVEANYPQFGAQFVEQEELVGQSHAIWLAREHISGPCFIVFADTISRIDLRAMAQADADGVLGVWQVDDPRRFGVAFTRPDGTVERCVEKPESAEHKLAIMGVYFVREGRDLIGAIEEQMARRQTLKGEFFLADAFNLMLEQGARFTTETMTVWQDCGVPAYHLATNRWLLDHGSDNSHTTCARCVNSTVIPPVHLADDCVIENSVVGPHAVIEAGCQVVDSRLRDVILMAGSLVQGSQLHDSLVGERVEVKGYTGSLNVGDDSQVAGRTTVD